MKSKKVVIGLFASLFLFGGMTTIELKNESQTAEAATVSYKQSNTSQLGELKTINSRIYTAPGSSKSVAASSKYTNEIFYVMKKATKTGGETYYQISRQSTVNAPVIGWVKSKSIKRSSYTIQNNVKKTYYIKGTGAGYTRPGGLPRNVLLPKMSTYKNASFTNIMTVKVGSALWYRATFNNQTVWLPASALVSKKSVTIASPVETKTSRVAKFKSASTKYQSDLTNSKTIKTAGSLSKSTLVITKAATYNKVAYYNVLKDGKQLGWVKQSDVTSYAYKAPTAYTATKYLLGEGYGYNHPWGATNNIVTKDLKALKNSAFKITSEAIVGKTRWYYGTTTKNQKLWIAANRMTDENLSKPVIPAPVETKTSRVAKFKSTSTKYQSDLTDSKTIKTAGSLSKSTLVITKAATYNKVAYYNVLKDGKQLGWVKQSDVTSYAYKAPTAYTATKYLLGEGYGYNHPWGATDNIVTKDLKTLKNSAFKITNVATVGKSLWYYGTTTKNQKLWVAANRMTNNKVVEVSAPVYATQSRQGILKANAAIYTDFNKLTKKTVTTNEKTEKFTINRSVKTDDATFYELTRMTTAAKATVVGWVKSTEVTLTSVTQPITSTAVLYLSGEGYATNIAGGTATANRTFKDLTSYPATKFIATKSQKINDTTYYLGKINSKYVWVSEANFGQPYRYFNLRKTSNITEKEMQDYLVRVKGTSIKSNNLYKGIPSFLEMQKKYGINAQFMLAHAIWETGWGSSAISKYKNNFFGYQAYDTCAMTCSMYFSSGKEGIHYYADAIYRKYLKANAIYNNGVSAAGMNVRYATDKTWAQNIARLMESMKAYDSAYYDKQPISTLDPAIPTFTNTNVIPAAGVKPPTYRNFDSGVTAKVTLTTPARLLPYIYGKKVVDYSVGKKITLHGTNDDVSGSWVRVIIQGKEAWVSRSAIQIENLGQATTVANIRDKATTSGSKVLATVPEKTFLKLILDTKGAAVTKKDASKNTWYQVQLPGKTTTGWISGTIFKVYK